MFSGGKKGICRFTTETVVLVVELVDTVGVSSDTVVVVVPSVSVDVDGSVVVVVLN